MFLSSWQHLLPLHPRSNVNRKQLHKNKLISSVGLADTLPFKARSSPPSLRTTCGPCSGTDLPISEQRSPWKEVSHGLWQEDKGFGGHDSPEESCRWTEKPRTWTTGCQRLFIACTILRLCYTRAQKSRRAARRVVSLQSWSPTCPLTSQLLSSLSHLLSGFLHHTCTCLCFSSVS